MRSSPRRLPIFAVLLSITAVLVWFTPEMTSQFEYDRAAIEDGQWWRLLTCPLTHFSVDHLAWDVGVFAILAIICESRNRRRLIFCTAVSTMALSISVWAFLPMMQHYRGLSGIDSALFVLLAVTLLREQLRPGGRRHIAVGIGVTLLLFAGKIAREFILGNTLFVNSAAAGMVPVPLAHLVGSVVGLLCSAVALMA